VLHRITKHIFICHFNSKNWWINIKYRICKIKRMEK